MRKNSSGSVSNVDDFVAIEEPLEIRVEEKNVAIVMRTPGHDRELAAGFLLSEGVIKSRNDVFEISECESLTTNDFGKGNFVSVLLSKEVKFEFGNLTRHVFTSSSCGICGKATIESIMIDFPKIERQNKICRSKIVSYPDKLSEAQTTFKKTGGLHASALFNPNGEIVVIREDVGRHNALDKVIGYALLENLLPLSDHTLLLSGRISFELMQKSLAAGIPTVAGISAPSSLAIEFAEKSGQNLIGFLRDQTMNIYSGNVTD
ncbi:MAG TPA: formate dehydrogenase accessory sulfurtransferase FdhD [Verrucomicrobia bacterium]|nr:formate dehydrogenase accessory sulfurtransferase FdhD [Verrucomicrobiales bacterium]HIL55850.1 formate dehydrogenase accessory sulfurtransferase FdhD [Verrucomicrobiota bacterium]